MLFQINLNMKKQKIGNKKLNLIRYGVFLAQLTFLPLFIAINPAAAESINNSQTTKINFIQDISSRYKVSISAKDLLTQNQNQLASPRYSKGSLQADSV